MKAVVFRVFRDLNRFSHRSPMITANEFNKLANYQLKRNYKNFGHARQKEPLGTVLWTGFIIFGICIGSFRFMQYVKITELNTFDN